jgi:hypothetical protein
MFSSISTALTRTNTDGSNTSRGSEADEGILSSWSAVSAHLSQVGASTLLVTTPPHQGFLIQAFQVHSQHYCTCDEMLAKLQQHMMHHTAGVLTVVYHTQMHDHCGAGRQQQKPLWGCLPCRGTQAC